MIEGLGNCPGEPHHIEVKLDVTPVINAPRKGLESLHKMYKITTDELAMLGIVPQVNK